MKAPFEFLEWWGIVDPFIFWQEGVLSTPLDFWQDGVLETPLDFWAGGVLSNPLDFDGVGEGGLRALPLQSPCTACKVVDTRVLR